MVNQALLGGIIGFILGGLVVSTVAVTMDKKEPKNNSSTVSTVDHNQAATDKLKSLKGDEFDKAFIKEMVDHHQGAIDMAKLIKTNAKHDELKKLGQDIISSQSKEINMMRAWRVQWGYTLAPESHNTQH